MFAYSATEVGILIRYQARRCKGFLHPFAVGCYPGHGSKLPLDCPGEIFGSRPRLQKFAGRLLQERSTVFPGGVQRGTVHAVGRGGADKPGAPDMHVPDRNGKICNVLQPLNGKAVRQLALINDLNDLRVLFSGPDGPVMRAVNVHNGRVPERRRLAVPVRNRLSGYSTI